MNVSQFASAIAQADFDAARERLEKAVLRAEKAHRKLADAKAGVDAAREAVDKAKKAADSFVLPPEPTSGSIIRFEMRFQGGTQSYSYAGIRASDRWYLTGKYSPTNGYTWQELILWLRRQAYVSTLRCVSTNTLDGTIVGAVK